MSPTDPQLHGNYEIMYSMLQYGVCSSEWRAESVAWLSLNFEDAHAMFRFARLRQHSRKRAATEDIEDGCNGCLLFFFSKRNCEVNV